MDYLLDSGFFNTIPFSIFETDKGINYLTTEYIVRTIINSKENVQIIENLNVLYNYIKNYEAVENLQLDSKQVEKLIELLYYM